MRFGPGPRIHPSVIHFLRPKFSRDGESPLRLIHALTEIVLRRANSLLPVNQRIVFTRLLLENHMQRCRVEPHRRISQRRIVSILHGDAPIPVPCAPVRHRNRELLLHLVALVKAINLAAR